MRYKKIVLTLILLIGSNPTVTGHASSVMTQGKIGFYEAPSTVPSPPSSEENAKKVQMIDSSNLVLPRTGEDSSLITFIGLFLIVSSTSLFSISKRNTKSA